MDLLFEKQRFVEKKVVEACLISKQYNTEFIDTQFEHWVGQVGLTSGVSLLLLPQLKKDIIYRLKEELYV